MLFNWLLCSPQDQRELGLSRRQILQSRWRLPLGWRLGCRTTSGAAWGGVEGAGDRMGASDGGGLAPEGPHTAPFQPL